MEQRKFANLLRKNMTDAEQLLWQHLRAHRLGGAKFKRQQPIGPYIVDFVDFSARLIVEADGEQHNESASDSTRDAWLKAQEFRILRFWNNEILACTDEVLERIWTELGSPLSPSPLPQGARGTNTGKN
jgi:very-short-patch-repair endonuclease